MLRKPDTYPTVHPSPLRGTDPVSVTPNSGIPHEDSLAPPRQSSHTHLHTLVRRAGPAPSALGRNVPPPCLGPVLIRKWEQRPGLGSSRPATAHLAVQRKYPQQTPLSPFLQNSRSLVFSPHNSKRGRGRIVTGQKRQKKLIKGRRRTGSFRHPPSPPPSRQ